jgi:putative peptidoglycan lipid II flippase
MDASRRRQALAWLERDDLTDEERAALEAFVRDWRTAPGLTGTERRRLQDAYERIERRLGRGAAPPAGCVGSSAAARGESSGSFEAAAAAGGAAARAEATAPPGGEPASLSEPAQPAVPGGSTSRATAIVMAGIAASRVAGLVREQVVALVFGRSADLSAFWAAFKLPNLFRVLAGEGNLSASFVPVLSAQLARGDERAARETSAALLGLLLVGVGAFTAAGILAAPALAIVAAPGFEGELRDTVVRLLRILFPLSGLLILGAWAMGVLHAHGRFMWPNLAPVFLSAVSALSLVLLLDRWGRPPIELLAWGTTAGGLVQLLVQLPASARVLGGLRASLRWGDAGVRRVLALFAPMLLGTGLAQLNALVETQIASFLDPEAVATLQYAVRLHTLPLSLFGTSVAMAALPSLARDSSGGAAAAFEAGVSAAWTRALFFLAPSTAALAAFGEPLVRVVFERGAFGPGDTAAVTRVLTFYALGLAAFASVRIFAGAFYALEDSRTPTRLSAAALLLNAALSALLAWRMGTPGIALASSLAAAVSALLLGRALARRAGPRWARAAAARIGRLGAATVAALALAFAADRILAPFVASPGFGPAVLRLGVVYGVLGLAYLTVTRLLGVLPPLRLRR